MISDVGVYVTVMNQGHKETAESPRVSREVVENRGARSDDCP